MQDFDLFRHGTRINTGIILLKSARKKIVNSSAKKGHFKAFWGEFEKFHFDTKKPTILLFIRVCGRFKVVRLEGVEPSSQPWEGHIIAVIRQPQKNMIGGR